MYSIDQVDETARTLQPEILYTLDFSRAPQHIIEVSMRFSSPEGKVPLVMPAWVPGSYKIRDFVSSQGDVTLRTDEGEEIPFRWISANRLEFENPREGEVEVSWTYFANEISVRHSHVNRFHAFLNPGNFLMYIPGRTDEPIGLALRHEWKRVSTPLSHDQDRDLWIATNFDVLVDSPIEIGEHDVATFTSRGAKHEVVITGRGNFENDWLVEQCEKVVESGFEFWETVPYDRYVFFLQFIPGQYGGLEHARSQVSAFDANVMREPSKVRRFLALLTHEFFHTWNVKRIRPIELGPFDYERENHSSMLWLAEGATSYFDDLISFRTGFFSRKEYLRILSDHHLTALFDVPGRHAMSIRDSSFLAWVKLYNQTPDSHNRFPSYYLKGGVLFLMLDLYVIRESNGESTLADGMRALYDRYRSDPQRGVTEDDFISIVTEATGVEISRVFVDWLAGTDDPPFEELLESVGLHWKEKETRTDSIGPETDLPLRQQRWFGFAAKEENGKVVIARVSDDSPATRAGIGTGDEVVGVDGLRVDGMDRFKSLTDRFATGESIPVLAASDGRLYETTIVPEERPPMHLVEVEDATDEAIRLREIWLGRDEQEEKK